MSVCRVVLYARNRIVMLMIIVVVDCRNAIRGLLGVRLVGRTESLRRPSRRRRRHSRRNSAVGSDECRSGVVDVYCGWVTGKKFTFQRWRATVDSYWSAQRLRTIYSREIKYVTRVTYNMVRSSSGTIHVPTGATKVDRFYSTLSPYFKIEYSKVRKLKKKKTFWVSVFANHRIRRYLLVYV